MLTPLTERKHDLLDDEELASGVRIIFDAIDLRITDGVVRIVASDGSVAYRWRCTICGYVHEAPEPPRWCPLCGADSDMFVGDEGPA